VNAAPRRPARASRSTGSGVAGLVALSLSIVSALRPQPPRLFPPCPGRASRRGFTLIEVMVVVGLIGLLAGVLITGSARLLADRPVTVEAVFWEALEAARKEALVDQREVRLRYDVDTKALVATSQAGSRSFPMPPGEVQFEFLAPVASTTNLVLIGGLLVETRPLASVTFFDDGTCTPFRVQIRTGGPARTLTVDPWTCAEVLPKEVR